MPSRLEDYPHSANFKDMKLLRSVKGILDQTFTDFELIIIADGCYKTKEIVSNVFTDERIKLFEVEHRALFDNRPRNEGIKNAAGDFITYCDIDDYWGDEHLAIINHNLKQYDWVWFNDYVYKEGQWGERACDIKRMGNCGTSNICHSRKMNVSWKRPGYAHDYYFINELRRYSNYAKIETPEYFVCHVPGIYDL